ncbi:MAG TPA: hypothetical protein VHB72_02320 [Candidatus Saccharimonadales bacterium]|nr:hypothetical protein [Candidatus Saccharimonadales bacterium]
MKKTGAKARESIRRSRVFDRLADPEQRKVLGRKTLSALQDSIDVVLIASPRERVQRKDERYLASLSPEARQAELQKREQEQETARRKRAAEFARMVASRHAAEEKAREDYIRHMRENNPSFDLRSWLDERKHMPKRVTVELGYGGQPLVMQHPIGPEQAYIGVEANLNPYYTDPQVSVAGFTGPIGGYDKKGIQAHLRSQRPEDNIFFIDIDAKHSDGRSVLPDGAADEVYINNVFDDPIIHGSSNGTYNLLAEAARLVTNEGKIIIADELGEGTIPMNYFEKIGLKADAFYAFSDSPEEWRMMEEDFYTLSPWNSPANDGYYYAVFSKAQP